MPRTSPPPADRILVIQLRQVGDVLLTTPALKALRACYPTARIDYLTEPGPSGVLKGNPLIDEVIIRKRHTTLKEDLALVGRLRRTRYDLVLDFMMNPRSAILTLLTGAPVRAARRRLGRSFYYSHPIAQKVDRHPYSPADKLAILEALGIPAPITPPLIQIPEEARTAVAAWADGAGLGETRIATFDITSRSAEKKWPGERFLALADHLATHHGIRCIFAWGPGEGEEVEALLKQSALPHLLAPPTSLMELAALIERSCLHVGNCSGPRHIAVAMGTPSLTIMGPTNPENWTYPSPEHRAIRGNAQCPECRQSQGCEQHRSIGEVSAEAAITTLEEMFSEGLIR
nr:glycosyltransferase family 9 protein [uncultured Holophaga sp.]